MIGRPRRSLVPLAQPYALRRKSSSHGNGGDRGKVGWVSGRRLRGGWRWRRLVVAMAVVAYILSLPTAVASTSGSRANGGVEWGAGMRLSGRGHCRSWQRRSVVPIANRTRCKEMAAALVKAAGTGGGEGGERPAGATAGTTCLAVPAGKRWQPPLQRRQRTESGDGGKRPAGAIAGTACQPYPKLKERSSSGDGGGEREPVWG